MASAREAIQNELSEFIVNNSLAEVYGGDGGYGKDKRSRCVGFSKRANLDGEILIFSDKFIVVKYQTRFLDLPHNDSRAFDSVDKVKDFLRLAFVEHKGDEAQNIPTVSKK